MICRITSGADFKGVFRYACKGSKRPELIHSTADSIGIGGVAKEFTSRAGLSSKCKSPVSHYVLSLGDGEPLGVNQWAEVVEKVMRSCGADQCYAVRHRDTEHDHVHIILNRVTITGKAWRTSNERHRMRALCLEVEMEYGLKRTESRSSAINIGKDEIERSSRLFREGKVASPVPVRLRVVAMVNDAYAKCKDWPDFTTRLAACDIDVVIRGDAASKPVNMKFCKDGVSIPVSACECDVRVLLSAHDSAHQTKAQSANCRKNLNLLNYSGSHYSHVR